ncbi:minor capsid protein [Bacillus norwichensis]|uniref:Minor capsid protein n=1 Tax=Bacillus norwichensis TaxID=2762217 RepID=A0ABR8VPA5_9BACI|nr:minor capsid protein [Bacillus norwichensis]MBD8006547.1 minor capsid protein [Bacillus norwichensis]
MNDFEKSLLKVVKEIYNLSDNEFNQVLLKYKASRDNIIQFLAEVFIQHGNDGLLDYIQLDRKGVIKEFDTKIEDELKEIGSLEIAILLSILGTVTHHTYLKTASLMERYLKLNITSLQMNPYSINEIVNFNWSGIPFSDRIWMNQQALKNSLKTTFVKSIQDGETLDKISNKFKTHFNSNAYQSERLLHTETARVIAKSHEELYRDTNRTKVEWVSALEKNTCAECADLDGSIFDIDDPSRPKIPRHPNCRCIYSLY